MYVLPFPIIDPVAIELGPIVIRWYALAYLTGFIAGWRYSVWLARRVPLRPDARDMDDYLTWAVIGTIIGGRLGYVLFYNLPHFMENPLDIVVTWRGGMSFHGGLLGVVLATVLFSRRRRINPLAVGDLVAAAAPIGIFFGRVANFINGELYGRPTDLAWGMVFPTADDQPRHPSQLYEAALEGLVLFVVLAVLARQSEIRRRPGLLSGVFLTGYGGFRFLVEFVREPDPQLGMLLVGTTMGQLLSLPMIAIGLWLALRAWSRPMAALEATGTRP